MNAELAGEPIWLLIAETEVKHFIECVIEK